MINQQRERWRQLTYCNCECVRRRAEMVATDSGGGVNIANNPKRAGSAIEQKKKFYVCTRAKSNVLNSEWVIRPDETDKLIN